MLDHEPNGAPDPSAADNADTDRTDRTGAGSTTRRRRKATKPAVSGESSPNGTNPPEGASAGAAPEEPTTPGDSADEAGATPARKTTRTRRKKAVPAAPDEPAVAGEPAAPGDPTPAAEAPADSAPGTQRRTRRRAPAAAAAPDDRAAEPAPAAQPASAVLFMAPDEAAPGPPEPEAADARKRRRTRRTTAPDTPTAGDGGEVAEPDPDPADTTDDGADPEALAGRRTRRRGRRGRGRGKGAHELDGTEGAEPAAAAAPVTPPPEDADGETLTRRRRRRRRGGAGGDAGTPADDEVPTVVKVREPRRSEEEVRGVSGSTRLEAKRQRRRGGRDQRRTRPPVLSESEFLARREAVDRLMVIRQAGGRTQIGVLEDGVLVEHYVTRATATSMAGSVYLGKVQNVLPSMEAAFIDVGRGRNAVLYAGEVNWDAAGLEGRSRSIEQALSSGDSVLVQVTKDPVGHKGARLTSNIALSGRHLVYTPHGNASGISRKLPDNERRRLRDILKNLVPDGAGVIVRTAAEAASADELARDVKRLQAQWDDIQVKAASGNAPALLYSEPDLVVRVVRDLFNEDFRELVVEGNGAYEMVEGYLSHVSPDLVGRVRRHTGTTHAFAAHRLDEQILKGLDRKVFLPSGGHLVFDRTEAMTVIDVNTGKYTGTGGNLEETVTRNNLEAAEEIVRQLRLRDIGGIIVVDFIDMVLEANRELVLRRLTECLGRDRTKHQVTEITSLGLVQMTRKRVGAGLLEAFSEPCDCCKGRGVVVHTEPLTDRPRPNPAAEKVKAIASASTPSGGGGRRRGRRSGTAAPSPVAAAPTATEPGELEDTMGYDLSRYEPEAPGSEEAPAPAGGPRLDPFLADRSAADPDAVEPGWTEGVLRRLRRGRWRIRP